MSLLNSSTFLSRLFTNILFSFDNSSYCFSVSAVKVFKSSSLAFLISSGRLLARVSKFSFNPEIRTLNSDTSSSTLWQTSDVIFCINRTCPFETSAIPSCMSFESLLNEDVLSAIKVSIASFWDLFVSFMLSTIFWESLQICSLMSFDSCAYCLLSSSINDLRAFECSVNRVSNFDFMVPCVLVIIWLIPFKYCSVNSCMCNFSSSYMVE